MVSRFVLRWRRSARYECQLGFFNQAGAGPVSARLRARSVIGVVGAVAAAETCLRRRAGSAVRQGPPPGCVAVWLCQDPASNSRCSAAFARTSSAPSRSEATGSGPGFPSVPTGFPTPFAASARALQPAIRRQRRYWLGIGATTLALLVWKDAPESSAPPCTGTWRNEADLSSVVE